MNCEHCRRAVLIDPLRLPLGAQVHLADCPECQSLLDDQLRQANLFVQVIGQTGVPGLHQRLSQAHRDNQLAQHARKAGSRRAFMGVAAGVSVGAVGLGVWWSQRLPDHPEQWARVIQQHFKEDPIYLLPADPQAAVEVDRNLREIGAHRLAELPKVLRGGICRMRRSVAVHLMFDWHGKRGVAFLLPQRTAVVLPLEADGWIGELRPLVGGMAAVFAQDLETAHELAGALAAIVFWQT